MKVMITGGAGYIGSHAVKAFLEAGHEVIVVDNLSHGFAAAIDKRARFWQLSVGQTAELTELLRNERVEAVLHFAAFIEVGESMENPGKYYVNNVANGMSLLNAMHAADVRRLVFSSTAAVYGIPQQVPIIEEHPSQPINPYGRSKWMMEQIMNDFARAHGIGYAALRYFNVAGASSEGSIGEAHEPESHLIPKVLAAAADPQTFVTVFGTDYPTPDGTCVRDFVHVEDLVEAHRLALDAVQPSKGMVYNIGSETGFSVQQVIEVCRQVTGKSIRVQCKARRPGDPPVLVASSARLRKELKWTPRYPDLATMITHAWNWLKTHPQGYTQAPLPT